MAFHFKRRESVEKAVRRLGRKRVEKALECLKDCERVEAIHCARKEIKKARAVLRLVRARMPKKQFSRPIGLLRQATDQLAPPRDAYIKAKTLRDLAHHFKGQLGPGSLRHVRATLREASDKKMRDFAKEKRVVDRRLASRCVRRQ